MNSALAVSPRQAPAKGRVALPPDLQDIVEFHVKKLKGQNPTRETVVAICKKLKDEADIELVLRYFLVESPLRSSDLGVLLCRNSKMRGKKLCDEAARERARCVEPPRWTAVNPS